MGDVTYLEHYGKVYTVYRDWTGLVIKVARGRIGACAPQNIDFVRDKAIIQSIQERLDNLHVNPDFGG